MPLIMLGKSSYRGELGPVGESGVEYTHLASMSVVAEQAPIRCFVKIYPDLYESGRPARGLVNEVVGYFCAESSGLRVPPRAGLIVVEVANLSSPPAWLASAESVVGWWSEDVGHPSLRATWDLDALPVGSPARNEAIAKAREFLLRHSGTPAVIALDDLVANIDRNLGNLLAGSGRVTLIDHGRTLTGPAWLPPELIPSASYENKVRSLLGPAAETLPFKSSVMDEYSSIVSKVSPRMPQLRRLLDGMLHPADSAAAHQFLIDRSSPRSVAHRVGVVA